MMTTPDPERVRDSIRRAKDLHEHMRFGKLGSYRASCDMSFKEWAEKVGEILPDLLAAAEAWPDAQARIRKLEQIVAELEVQLDKLGREGTDKAAAWGALVAKNRRIAALTAERDREAELRRDAERRLAEERSMCCDKPEDRLWHAADGTWWRRDDEGRLVRAEPPGHVAELAAERERLREALAFYADPESYVGISFLADPPCGEFVDDYDDEHEHALHLGVKPGRRARAALGEQEGA